MPRLVDVEVEEVSLVDRPATGRRFRIFKRNTTGRFLERLLGTSVPEKKTGESSAPAGSADPIERSPSEEETVEPEAVLKRLENAFEMLTEQQQELQKRLERLEETPRTRHSFDTEDSETTSLWKGVLA